MYRFSHDHVPTMEIVLLLSRPTGRTAVAASCDTKQAVHEFQFTTSWIVSLISRRFGMDAEPSGCALLAAMSYFVVVPTEQFGQLLATPNQTDPGRTHHEH